MEKGFKLEFDLLIHPIRHPKLTDDLGREIGQRDMNWLALFVGHTKGAFWCEKETVCLSPYTSVFKWVGKRFVQWIG